MRTGRLRKGSADDGSTDRVVVWGPVAWAASLLFPPIGHRRFVWAALVCLIGARALRLQVADRAGLRMGEGVGHASTGAHVSSAL